MLLDEPISPPHKKIVLSIKESQDKYVYLTKRKYAYFWTIYNKYLPIQELEYSETIQVKDNINIHKQLNNKYTSEKRKK
jgi:hypothetical protein